MLLKSLILLLAMGSSLAALMSLQLKISSEQRLLDLLLKSHESSGNSELNQYCFNRYRPLLKAVADQYEKDYEHCVVAFHLECEVIDAIYIIPREEVDHYARSICRSLQKCDDHASTLEAFECFAARGSEESKRLYSLSADAGVFAREMKELRRAAQSICDACTSQAEREYWENTLSTYEELSECLNGKAKLEGSGSVDV
ncbi:hypothetical protein KR222_000399 [Zaprionus bogoriensis]|nr:hypothetical protein KR222_000399 [Zaprionus bogoriensis]